MIMKSMKHLGRIPMLRGIHVRHLARTPMQKDMGHPPPLIMRMRKVIKQLQADILLMRKDMGHKLSPTMPMRKDGGQQQHRTTSMCKGNIII